MASSSVWYDCGEPLGQVSSGWLDNIQLILFRDSRRICLYQFPPSSSGAPRKTRLSRSDVLEQSLQKYVDSTGGFTIVNSGTTRLWIRSTVKRQIARFVESGAKKGIVEFEGGIQIRLPQSIYNLLRESALGYGSLQPECLGLIVHSGSYRGLFADHTRTIAPGPYHIPDTWHQWETGDYKVALSPSLFEGIEYVRYDKDLVIITKTSQYYVTIPFSTSLLCNFFNAGIDRVQFLLGVPQKNLLCLNLWRKGEGVYEAQVHGRSQSSIPFTNIFELQRDDVAKVAKQLCSSGWVSRFQNLVCEDRLVSLCKDEPAFKDINKTYVIVAKEGKLSLSLSSVELRMNTLTDIDQLLTRFARGQDSGAFYILSTLK